MACPCCGPQCCLPSTINLTVSGGSGLWVIGNLVCFDGDILGAPRFDPDNLPGSGSWPSTCARPSLVLLRRIDRNYFRGHWSGDVADSFMGSYSVTQQGCGNYEGIRYRPVGSLLAYQGGNILCTTVPNAARLFVTASVDVQAQRAYISISLSGGPTIAPHTFSGSKSVDLSGGCPADISGTYILDPPTNMGWLTFPGCRSLPQQTLTATIS